jgi:hypothetical protein
MMGRYFTAFSALIFVVSGSAEDVPFPKFREHVVNAEAGTGLAITVADINNDGKPDIVGVSSKDVYWYENPIWTPHLIADTLKNSNVCVAAHDLNGDGTPELAVGADWQFNNTTSGGALFLLHASDNVTKPWNVVTLLDEEPTLHRIRWADVDGDGPKELIVAPLKGVGSTPPNFDDKGVKLFLLRPDHDDPFKAPWTEEVIDTRRHVMHNIWTRRDSSGVDVVYTASYEGVSTFKRDYRGRWRRGVLVAGNPEPLPRSGAGEIKTSARGTSPKENASPYVNATRFATIEPWHGNQAVVYAYENSKSKRYVLDDGLRSGHAIGWADFDQDGQDEVFVGYRDKAPPGNKAGLQIYDLEFSTDWKPDDPTIAGWTKHIIDDGGMATEDALAADMNGDEWPDVVAFGRATHNIKYYENLGLEK